MGWGRRDGKNRGGWGWGVRWGKGGEFRSHLTELFCTGRRDHVGGIVFFVVVRQTEVAWW